MGSNFSPQEMVANISYQDASGLIKPSNIQIDSNIESKILMPSFSNSIGSVKIRIKTKSDLRNSQWLKDFVSTVRGGDNEKLIKSILSKVSESDLDIASINKVLKRLAEITIEIGANDNLLRILAELEKPVPLYCMFVERFISPNPLSSTSTPTIGMPDVKIMV